MVNEQIEHCLYESGLAAQGCWDELDDYAKEAIERFAKLIVRESCYKLMEMHENVNGDHNYYHHVSVQLKRHFGVEVVERLGEPMS